MDSRLEVVAHAVNRLATIRKIIDLIPGALLFVSSWTRRLHTVNVMEIN
jgi:hypothetical protein